MSWLGGYKGPAKKSDDSEAREEKRKKLEAERHQRAQQREKLRKQVQEAKEAQEIADKAAQDLLALDPEILTGEETYVSDSEIEDLLGDTNNLINPEDMAPDPPPVVAFEAENGADEAKAMDNLRTVQCPFNKEDIAFWFSQLEDQLTLIGVKAQWTKKIALVRFLPPEIQSEVKSLLKLNQVAAGDDIYMRIKAELLELFGDKPEDAYMRAKSRVMTGKPSQLGKLLMDDLTDGDITCDNCAKIVWGMFRESLPIVVRNHIAELPFTKETYKSVFKKADQVWDSNRASEPNLRQVSAVQAAPVQSQQEVAAVQKGQSGKNQNRGRGQGNQNRGQSQGSQKGQNQSQNGQGNKNQNSQTKPDKTKLINDEGLCKIHAKWKKEANFCAAPWGCKMKNVYKEPQ